MQSYLELNEIPGQLFTMKGKDWGKKQLWFISGWHIFIWARIAQSSIVTRLQAGWLGFDSWHKEGFFSLCHHMQTSSGGLPSIISNKYIIGLFPWDKAVRVWRWLLLTSV